MLRPLETRRYEPRVLGGKHKQTSNSLPQYDSAKMAVKS